MFTRPGNHLGTIPACAGPGRPERCDVQTEAPLRRCNGAGYGWRILETHGDPHMDHPTFSVLKNPWKTENSPHSMVPNMWFHPLLHHGLTVCVFTIIFVHKIPNPKFDGQNLRFPSYFHDFGGALPQIMAVFGLAQRPAACHVVTPGALRCGLRRGAGAVPGGAARDLPPRRPCGAAHRSADAPRLGSGEVLPATRSSRLGDWNGDEQSGGDSSGAFKEPVGSFWFLSGCRFLRGEMVISFGALRTGGAPAVMYGIFCGPRSCNENSIGRVAMHHFMAQLLKRPIEMIRRPEEDEVGKGVLPWSKLYGSFPK